MATGGGPTPWEDHERRLTRIELQQERFDDSLDGLKQDMAVLGNSFHEHTQHSNDRHLQVMDAIKDVNHGIREHVKWEEADRKEEFEDFKKYAFWLFTVLGSSLIGLLIYVWEIKGANP